MEAHPSGCAFLHIVWLVVKMKEDAAQGILFLSCIKPIHRLPPTIGNSYWDFYCLPPESDSVIKLVPKKTHVFHPNQ
jgi:hypothetical protein